MQKPKEYDWKDSNMALFGSDVEKKVKKESAESEPAWHGSGQEVGVEIWRINKFKVEKWPIDEYGSFYSGDSYIILNTYKDEEADALLYDVHFWIGKYSTQDEYGTAAYKTVELDTYHEDKPVQHREVQGRESRLFKTYFDTIIIMKGGCATGFKRVLPEAAPKRLFQVVRDDSSKKTVVKEIPMKAGNLNDEDVFVIDLGLNIYQYNGKTCNKDEKFKAAALVQKLESDRGGKCSTEVLDSTSTSMSHPAMQYFKEGKSKDKTAVAAGEKSMWKLSDAEGRMKFESILEGSLERGQLESNDVFLVDDGEEVFVWIGAEASVDERKNALSYSHEYLKEKEDPFKPVTIIGQGQKCAPFEAIW